MDRYSIKMYTRARRDLDNIYAYISHSLLEPTAAQKLLDEIEAGILTLEEMPNRCAERRRGIFSGKGYRQLQVKNYMILFRVLETQKQVDVVSIRYSRSSF